MKVVIPGGSGQVGTVLARAFHGAGHDVVVLSRRPDARPWRVVAWDGATLGGWQREIDGADVVINLAGRSVNCRYTHANREELLQSRALSTQVVGQAIAQGARQPRVWLQASTATIYAHRYDAANDEYSGILGGREPGAPDTWRFSIDVASAWERAFDEAITNGTRKVALRSAMTLSPDAGGVFDTLLGLARFGLGGRAGDGRQFISWIHYEDFIEAVRWLIDRDDIDGAVNVASPNPLPNADFMRVLRQSCGLPFGLPLN
ncbi:MAG TPA: NAD-dependent epimerase/dehydratase family protein, partial [Vicinamibacterales bacterium]|nr:NAD-dependent epimerase/dehydratase family protein [Vicinamibacterales bacterium]